MNTTKIAIFRKREIRKTIHNNEWWFVVNDVVLALTDTPNVQDYVKKMRKRDNELSKGWGQIVTPLSVHTSGGDQKLNCANTEGVFRIIQSIPSPKAEPFKRWLARVGLEVDHRYPVAKNGNNDMENLQALCWECNQGKKDKV